MGGGRGRTLKRLMIVSSGAGENELFMYRNCNQRTRSSSYQPLGRRIEMD